MILSATSSSEEMVPEAIDHVGIIVYGHLYEYGDLGVLRSVVPLESDPKSKYPVFQLRSRETLGETTKTQEEFEAWVAEQNEGPFQGSNYDVVTTSCVVWAMHACNFLEIPYPENWDKLCDWAEENKTVAGLFGGSGVASRRVQIRVPQKIKTFAKKHFKRDSKTNDGSKEEAEDDETEDNESKEDDNEVKEANEDDDEINNTTQSTRL
ncbi:hypothetical protein Ocin01_08868 [Orchesella cincta]|uniref:PPPDE domain-containing protein n=1 Tax=Orchesella cincta TaxID=48709 RepID=A0A1D2MXL9_ORCCI|nr:hypothetical protein Ocin01_08868 [Orchesella cincta]